MQYNKQRQSAVGIRGNHHIVLESVQKICPKNVNKKYVKSKMVMKVMDTSIIQNHPCDHCGGSLQGR
jgi:hypothetical protein